MTKVGYTSWENLVAADTSNSDSVVIMGNNDTAGGINYVYVGTKTNTGTKFDKAGLTNGSIYGYKVTGAATDAAYRTAFGKNNPQPFTLTTALAGATGALQQSDGISKGAITLDRTEDGSWDPSHPNDFYFVTTGSTAATATHGRGGLWKMSFVDRTNPSLGGTLTLLLDGNEAAPLYMPDNLTVDGAGHVMIQEDPGGDDYVARVSPTTSPTKTLAPVATFDPAKFGVGGADFITNDEESSGIIPAPARSEPEHVPLRCPGALVVRAVQRRRPGRARSVHADDGRLRQGVPIASAGRARGTDAGSALGRRALGIAGIAVVLRRRRVRTTTA